MSITSRLLAIVVGATISFALPSMASATRVYYLVGMRHVYRIGFDKYYQVEERKRIEEDYADEVSADNAHFQFQISHGANRYEETAQLRSALHDLAVEREQRLSRIYDQCDWVRKDHPCFNIKVDGPYQVIGVDYHERSTITAYHVHETIEVWDDCVCYAPWPGYACVDPPYGWGYGVVYTPSVFVNVYTGWYGGWVGFGCPAFVGFYGVGGPIVCAGLSINVGVGFGIGGGFFYNPGLVGYYHPVPAAFASDPFRGRYIGSVGDPRAALAARAGYAAGTAAIRTARVQGFARGIAAGNRAAYAAHAISHGVGTANRSGYVHAASAVTNRGSRGGGYSHSAVTSARSGAMRNRSVSHNFNAHTTSARGRSSARSANVHSSFLRSGSGSSHSYSHSGYTAGGSSRGYSGGRSMGPTRSFGGGGHGGGDGRRRGG